MRTNAFGIRRNLREMTAPAAIAYVLITVLTLLARTVAYFFALVAEVAERVAIAGETARDAAHQADGTDLPEPTAFGRARAAHAPGGGW